MKNCRLVGPFLLALGACVQEPTIPRTGEQLIELTITTSVAQFRAGEPDTITVTATNHYSEPLRLEFPTTCQIRVYIRDGNGRIVVPENGTYSCVPVNSQIAFPANGSVARQFVWHGGTQFVPPGSSTSLAPGRYYVTAEMSGFGYSTRTFPYLVTIVE